jgi:peptide deformylase
VNIKSVELELVAESAMPDAQPASGISLAALFVAALKMEHLCTKESGIGLSAVQVGMPWEIFVVRRGCGTPSEHYEYYVDCRYFSQSHETIKSIEGCLSLKRDGKPRRFEVERYKQVSIIGKRLLMGPEGLPILEDVDFKEEGLYGIVFQHEIDHSMGILISQIGTELEVA